jgi:hypothetical protein
MGTAEIPGEPYRLRWGYGNTCRAGSQLCAVAANWSERK